MSKKGFHGNGRYYYENGYRSKKAVRDTYPEGNDEEIRGINKVRDELMRKIDSVTRAYASKCAGRMLSDVVNEIYGISTASPIITFILSSTPTCFMFSIASSAL